MMGDESVIQRAIINAARAAGWLAIRLNSGKVRVKGGWMQLAPPGTPDLLLVGHHGRLVWIETKAATGALRADQDSMHDELAGRGQRVVVCRSLDDLASVLATDSPAAA